MPLMTGDKQGERKKETEETEMGKKMSRNQKMIMLLTKQIPPPCFPHLANSSSKRYIISTLNFLIRSRVSSGIEKPTCCSLLPLSPRAFQPKSFHVRIAADDLLASGSMGISFSVCSPRKSCLMSLLACEVVNWFTISKAVWLQVLRMFTSMPPQQRKDEIE